MRIIPVIDLKQGIVVRGIGGRRREYQAIVSQLSQSSQPHIVASALAKNFAFREFYVADLDAIEGGKPAASVFSALSELASHLWIDAGVQDLSQVETLLRIQLASCCQLHVVLGLESIEGPKTLRQIVERIGAERVVFSLDLKSGAPLCREWAWGERTPLQIAEVAIDHGVERLIVLDLAKVGTGKGTGTLNLCRTLSESWPDVELIAGGGIDSIDDLRQLSNHGVHAALVASALHDGKLTPNEIAPGGLLVHQ